jgi:Ca2+-binding EF-hand superfamily protein
MKRTGSMWTGLGVAAVCGLFAAPALADTGMSLESKFKKADANGDGLISREEHATSARDHYQKMDGNADGYVTLSEIKALHDDWKGPKPKAWKENASDKLSKMDGNGDGRLTAAEHAAYKAQLFDDWDADRDGMLTESEFSTGMRMKHGK